MNKSTPTTPPKKPTNGRTTPISGASKKPGLAARKPGPENGYTPSYTPDKDAIIPSSTNVENRIDIPSTLTTVSLSDLTQRIIDNASVLHPGVPLKVVTAKAAGSVCSYNALVASPKNPDRSTSRWQVEVKGPVVNMSRNHEEEARRQAMEVLLEDLERKVAKELLER